MSDADAARDTHRGASDIIQQRCLGLLLRRLLLSLRGFLRQISYARLLGCFRISVSSRLFVFRSLGMNFSPRLLDDRRYLYRFLGEDDRRFCRLRHRTALILRGTRAEHRRLGRCGPRGGDVLYEDVNQEQTQSQGPPSATRLQITRSVSHRL